MNGTQQMVCVLIIAATASSALCAWADAWSKRRSGREDPRDES